MRIMPHAVPCEWVSPRRTMVESNMKVYIWLVKSLHNVLFFLLHFIWFSSCPLGFFCTLALLLSLSPCCQPSAAFSTRVCKTRTLWRDSCTWHMSFWACTWVQVVSASWHSWAWQTCRHMIKSWAAFSLDYGLWNTTPTRTITRDIAC